MKTFSKITLAATLGFGLAVASAMNVAQADSRHHRGDRGDQFERGGFHGDHRHHHMRISERCAEHPHACARRHAHRAARHEYRHTMREIRESRRFHGYRPHYRHHRHHDSRAVLFLPMPGQIALRVDLR